MKSLAKKVAQSGGAEPAAGRLNTVSKAAIVPREANVMELVME